MWESQALAGERMLHALRDLPEDESVDLLRRLRQNENVEDILRSLTLSGSDGTEHHESATSDAASHYSEGSEAMSAGSVQASSSQLHHIPAQQQAQATLDAQAQLPDRGRIQDMLSIGFLVNDEYDTEQSSQQQSRMQIDQTATPSPHNINRMHSYPPVSSVRTEARKRSSLPDSVAIDSLSPTAGPSHEVYRADGSCPVGPGTSTHWDNYYTTVSRLMRKIGETPEPHQ